MARLKTWFIYLARFKFLAFGLLTAITASNAAADTIVYGGNILGRRDMIEVNLTTNSSQRVDATLFDTQAMAQDPATGLVYYFEASTYFSSGNELAYWDPETSTNTRVRTYSPSPWDAAKRAAFDPNGDLYMMDSGGEIFIVNTTTGDLGFIGQVRGVPTASYASGDMAFSPDGTLYLVIDDNLYRVDLEAIPLEAVLLDSNMRGSTYVWTGLAYCNGSLYATDINPYSYRPDSSVFRIDLDGDTVTGVTELFSHYDMINDLTSCSAVGGGGNLSPELVLDPVGDQDIDIGETLVISVTATDPDGDDLNLTYEASGLPTGATFMNQEFDWTPSAGQEGLYEITFTVTDSGSPPKEDSETITIVVGNLPPQMNPIGNRSVDVGDLLEFTVTATDPNSDDVDLLTYIMDLPDAVLDPSTGLFRWTPDTVGDYTVTFTVTDPDGEEDSETIVIYVEQEQSKSRCGAVPMTRDGGPPTRLAEVHTAGKALLPLLPSIIALGLWGIYRVAGRRKNRKH